MWECSENAVEISVYDQSATIGIVNIYLETLKENNGRSSQNLRNDEQTKMTNQTMKDDTLFMYLGK